MFIPKQREAEILAAIAAAEKNTSGEIRLHIEAQCPGKPMDRAIDLFDELAMHQTEARNGVLLYIAWRDRKAAIFGDAGIHEKVGQAFWDEDISILIDYFKVGKVVEGLIAVINQIGDKLKEFFPYATDDVNELSNEISFGEGNHHV